MKQFFRQFSVFVCMVVLSCPVWAETGLVKIAENVYTYADVKNASAANSFSANAGIVIGKDGIAVIDTLVSAKEAKRFIDDIRKVSDKPVKYVINTHYHLDHAFGNSEFAKLGAVIICHENCKINMKKTADYGIVNAAKTFGMTDEDMQGTESVYPTFMFDNRMYADLGDVSIELLYIKPSHTNGSILVYLPEHKILFTGDILFTDFHPFMGDGDIAGWTDTLDFIMSMDTGQIIPGHGPLSSKKDITEMKDYLITFDKKAKELSSASDNPDHIAAELKKSLPQRSQGEWIIKTNIEMKYLKK